MKFLKLLLVLCLLPGPTRAAEAPDPTPKLREQLRGVMLQLRTAQTESANAQVAQAAAEQRNTELVAKVTDLGKRNATLVSQAATDKTAADKALAALTTKLAESERRTVQCTAALEKWQAGYAQAAALARSKEDERAKLAAEALVLKRTIADRETKNIALFNTANEILDRFENYALGKALAAREPFIGTTRVKIETLVQGYRDKILDQRLGVRKPAPKP
ncbi:MAG: phage major capsid protein [Verrucomicrobia bacterium]|nr:phage major capsid protein [Verrucomicrobiota bacterium]